MPNSPERWIIAQYRNYIIRPAHPTWGKGPRKTSSILVLHKDKLLTLLKQFRFAVDSDESIRGAIRRAKNYVDHVADRTFTETAQRHAQRAYRHVQAENKKPRARD